MAQQLGLPIHHFIAANNENQVVTEYLKTENYSPKPTVQTISNAMDVGNPSNFIRIQEIFKNEFKDLKNNLSSRSYSDEETREGLKELYKNYNYIADPHGAIGYLAAKDYLKSNPDTHCVFLETAHPTKFLDTVEASIQTKVDLPPQIKAVIDQKKKSIQISTYEELKFILLGN
jgi:threonine synthase